MSKLTLVRSKTDNVLVIKNKQPASHVHHHHRHRHRQQQQQQLQPGRSRAGRSLKPKRPKFDVDSSVDRDEDRGRSAEEMQPDQDTQCKIVKVILENCKSSTTSATNSTDVDKTVNGSSSSACRDGVEVASPLTPSITSQPGPSTSSEASSNVGVMSTVCSAASCTVLPSDGVTTSSTWLQPTQITQLSSTTSTMTDVFSSAASLRLAAPLNGIVSALPPYVHPLQLLGHPAARNLAPVTQRWSVPLMNGAGTWLTLQPVTSTSPAPIVVPTQSFGLAAPAAAQGAPPRPTVVVEQGRADRPYVAVSHCSVINSPIKQFLDNTRSVPINDDAPTDLSMKTLRRLEEDARDLPRPVTQDDDVPLDLCIKRPTPTSHSNPVKRSVDVDSVPTTKTPAAVLPILTVPLCFTTDRPRLTVAGQVVPPTITPSTASCLPAIKLVQPPTPLLKIDAATVRAPTAAFPVSPVIVHPAFRQLTPPFLCSPLLMAPFAATGTSVARHPTDVSVPPPPPPPSSSSSWRPDAWTRSTACSIFVDKSPKCYRPLHTRDATGCTKNVVGRAVIVNNWPTCSWYCSHVN